MKKRQTERGFEIIEFVDSHDQKCSIQKSSSINDAIWFGIDDANPLILASRIMKDGVGWAKYPIHPDVLLHTRMHLTVDQVKELIPILQRFVETGEI